MTLHAFPTRQDTHHVWYDTVPDHRLAVAVCGVILPRGDSVPDPTCPICRHILAEHDLLTDDPEART